MRARIVRQRVAITRAALVAGALAAYQILATSGVLDPTTFVSATHAARAAADLVSSSSYRADDLVPTVVAVLASWVIGSVIGVLVGLIAARVDIFDRVIRPYLLLFYALPIFALYPVMVALFGAGRTPIILLATVYAGAIVVSDTSIGMRAARPVWIKVGRLSGLNGWSEFIHILLPAAATGIFTGVRLALSYSVIVVIGSEFLLSDSGVGHEIADSYNNFEIAPMYGGITLVIVTILVLNCLLGRLQRVATRGAAQ